MAWIPWWCDSNKCIQLKFLAPSNSVNAMSDYFLYMQLSCMFFCCISTFVTTYISHCFLRSPTGGCNFSNSVCSVYWWFALWTWTVWSWLFLGWPVCGCTRLCDDLTLATSPAALRKLLYICEQLGAKTQCIKFHVVLLMLLVVYFFCGKSIFCPKSVVHLGHVLTTSLMDNADILRCSRDFCKQANGILDFVILLYRLDCSLIILYVLVAVLCGFLIVVKLNA